MRSQSRAVLGGGPRRCYGGGRQKMPEGDMTFTGINYLAVLVAAVVAWVVGAAWYMSLSKAWVDAQERTMEEFKAAADAAKGTSAAWMPYVLALVAELIMAWVLAGLLAHLGPGQTTIWNGIVSAAFVWLGFVATTIAVNNMFGMKRVKLTVIDSGHWLAVLLVMGAIIGAFG
jgi:hypothetical protein